MIKQPLPTLLFAIFVGSFSMAVTVSPNLLLSQTLQQTHTATSEKNMVASVHPLATAAGLQAFKDGGNAIDAAIATALTLGVVDGFNSGIGGGCFILIRTSDGEFFAIDGREMAPAAAHAKMYVEAKSKFDRPSQTGALASGVPGALAAFHQAVTQHGKLKFKNLIQPAAKIADDGFQLSAVYAARLSSAQKTMQLFPGSREIFFHESNGKFTPYQTGETLKQTHLAQTYRNIADNGPSWFYNGPFATQTEAWMKENGGIMTSRDFANYHTVNRSPIRTTYRGFEIVGFPPPSSGGVHVSQILNILENFDLKKLYNDDPASMYHVVAEAMKFAFADRAKWLGDPDFVDVPIGLIAKEYAKQIAANIKMDSTTAATAGTPPESNAKFFEKHTTHIATADADGNWVALTSTVNTTFGAKYVVPGLGVVMNNQMDDFVAIPGKANAFGLVGSEKNWVEAKKRPLSSMSPTIILKNGQPVLTAGAAGGPKIITEVIWAIINHIDLDMPIGKAIGQPRLHHQWSPKQVLLESNFDDSIAKELAARNHSIKRSKSMGTCQAISFDPETKKFTGAHDPRTTGSADGQ
ncbi:MAG: gamma-glutamyltransferase [Mariniblastus sp.]